MADILLDFTPLSDINPYTNGSWIKPTGAIDGKIVSGRFVSTSTTNAVILYNGTPTPVSNEVTVNIVIGEFTGDTTASRGHAIMASNGDGYFTLIRSNDLRVYKTTAGGGANTLTQIGSTISLTAADSDDWLMGYNTTTGAIRVLQNGVSQFTATDTTHVSAALKLGVCSRATLGRLRSVTVHGITVYSVTSINGGSPITASQTSSSAITEGFTGLPTSITSNQTGLTFSSISGTTNAPTFVKSVRVDGQQYPKNGTVASVTFTKSDETASGNVTCNKDDAETAVIVASPILDDISCLFGAIFAATGRSAANGDEVYHKIPSAMLTNGADTILPADAILPNGEMQFYNAGTFTMWMWTAATGVYYYYDVTITESNGGLTIRGLTVSGPPVRGLTVTGL